MIEEASVAPPLPKNVLGTPLRVCCYQPITGFYRTGLCETGPDDRGEHLACIEATAEFLEFSKARGNDLSTPNPMFEFPGLKPGDRAWAIVKAASIRALPRG